MKFFDRDPDYYRTHDSLPMLRRVAIWGSLYQMAMSETIAQGLNVMLADSKYHVLALIAATLGPILGTPCILSVVVPQRFNHLLEEIDDRMRQTYGFPKIRRDPPLGI